MLSFVCIVSVVLGALNNQLCAQKYGLIHAWYCCTCTICAHLLSDRTQSYLLFRSLGDLKYKQLTHLAREDQVRA